MVRPTVSFPGSGPVAVYGAVMSTVTRPRGPLPARVYWVRRALLLAIVFALVFTLARVFGGGGDEPPTAKLSSGGPQQLDRGAEETTSSKTSTKPKKNKKKKKPVVVLAEPDGPCAPAEVSVAATIRSAPAGADSIEIPLELTTERAACTFRVSKNTTVLKLLSGKDQIWTSQHCPKVLGTHDVVVRAAQPAVVTVSWNGRRSAPKCERGTGWADIGGYHAIAAAFGGEPVDQYFELTKPEPEVVTKTRKPKKDKKNKTKKKNGSTAGTTPTDEKPGGDGAEEPGAE